MSGASDMLDAALDIERPEPYLLVAGSERSDGICVATLPSGCALIPRDTAGACVLRPVDHHAL